MENEFEMGLFDELHFADDNINPDAGTDPLLDDLNNVSNEVNENINHEGESSNESSESVAGSEDDQGEGDDTNEGTNDTPPNLFSSVATVLYDEGVLPSLDIDTTKIENVDDLANAVKSEVQSLYEQKLIQKFGKEGFDYIDKGVSVQEVESFQDRSNILNNITEDGLIEDVELSKNVIYEDYLSRGMSPERAAKIIDRTATIGDEALVEDAKESLANLKVFNQNKLNERAQSIANDRIRVEKENAAKELKVKNSIYGVSALENGPSINKQVQDNVYGLMTTVVGNAPDGSPENAVMKARRENSVDFDTKLYYVYELTKGFTDFSKFGKAAKNSAISDLERAFQANKNDYNGNPSYINDKNSYDSPLDGHILNI